MSEPAESVQAVDSHGERVQDMFTRISRGYDRANRWMSAGTDIAWRRAAVRRLMPTDGGSGSAPRVLDLCAGTLDSTLEIHRQHPNAQILAGDFSEGMLAAGQSKLVGTAGEHIRTRAMDAHELPCEDNSRDAIFCAFGVRNLSELRRATAEQARVLRPGGRLTVLEFFRPQALSTRVFHGLYNRTVLPVVGWAATGHMDAYLYLPRSIGKFDTVEDYVALLRECGFTDVTAQPLTMGIAWIVRATRGGTG